MTLRDKIMDRYWLDFLASNQGDFSTWRQFDAAFWHWFYTHKMNGVGNGNLESYL